MRVVHDIDRDELVLGVLHDALHRILCSIAEDLIDLFNAGFLLDFHDEVGDRAVGNGHAKRHAVEFTGEVGEYEADGAGGAGRRRDDRQRSGAGAAEVLVRRILQVLIGRVGVDRRHEATSHRKPVVEQLHHRSQAVGGAAGIGNHLFVARQNVIVHAEHDRGINLTRSRCRDHDLFRAGCDML